MDYIFENLGDDRFQEFCHSIVNMEFNNTQAFPVGQPDGGRDSISYIMNSKTKEFAVFQVKYVRNPLQIKDAHKWLTEIIDGEKEKVKKLIPKGAKCYYLITNVKGTAHLEVGSIDKTNKILEESIPIPSICWWRDDLSRKLESNPMLKWSFPELLNGQDVLNNFIFQNLNENKERRESVLKAYLIDQYEIDNEVKFKQIELQNRLFDLFVDVPIMPKKIHAKDKRTKRIIGYMKRKYPQSYTFHDEFEYNEDSNIGAVSLILNQHFQQNVERILLEGGPGQGKSTISQFICQVHRARLLNKYSDIGLIPEEIKSTPIRIPFKIDLRDMALWVEKKNPYIGSLGEEYFNNNWHKSLESFIIAHLCYHSKLEDFNTSDFISICKLSSILLVFDGFDEIANINLREEIIEFINRGINRLKENTKSIQVIVTSRPAAFSSSVGFSSDMYPHFELTDITRSTTKEYVEKWIKSKNLRKREATEIRKLVDEKLEMPHLKDLAKSPMQLAILISLLNTRGESLPNKRTSLYDSYIELFFNREAEKNTIIRDKRELIIDIHQYLAWVLHSEAEQYKNSGRIDIEKLKEKLKFYLKQEGHDENIADKLFTVMKERVCALVSRVQGTFEFEVQPLREYFCAKYLYNTAPYTPVGCESTGTKPERFEALSRNIYWHNVVRFFAGCFDRGELPMLIQKLNELQDDDVLKYTNYPRTLTSQLLSDWVFTQYPKLLNNVVKIITDGLNIGNILNQDRLSYISDQISLPLECGRIEMVNECFLQLKKLPPYDYALELIGIIVNNPDNTTQRWMELSTNFKDADLTTWFGYANHLQVLHKIDIEFLIGLLNTEIPDFYKRVQFAIQANRMDLLDKDFKIKDAICDGILDGDLFFMSRRTRNHIFSTLSMLNHPYYLVDAIRGNNEGISFKDLMCNRYGYYDQKEKEMLQFEVQEVKTDNDLKLKKFFELIQNTLNLDITYWNKSLKPWDDIVETSREIFGEKWSQWTISIIAAGIRSQQEKYESFKCLSDDSVSLSKRIRFARLKSGNVKWWTEQIESSQKMEFTLLVFFTWATIKTIESLIPLLEEKLQKIEIRTLEKLLSTLNRIASVNEFDLLNQRKVEVLIGKQKISPVLKYILSLRFNEYRKQSFIYSHISDFPFEFKEISELKLEYLIEKYLNSPSNVKLLSDIKNLYRSKTTFNRRNYRFERYLHSNKQVIPYEIATSIMKNCKEYPRILSSLAERTCRFYANKSIISVGEIAEKDKWFTDNELST